MTSCQTASTNMFLVLSTMLWIACLSDVKVSNPGVMDFGTIRYQRDIRCNNGIKSEEEFKEICEVVCLPLHCKNELLHSVAHDFETTKVVKSMRVECEENLSCIAKIRMDGGQFESLKDAAKPMKHKALISPTHTEVITEKGELSCGTLGQTCVAGQYSMINFKDAYFFGNARDSNIIFKVDHSSFFLLVCIHCCHHVKDTNVHIGIYNAPDQFIMNSIFTAAVLKFEVDVSKEASHSLSGNVFNLGGLDLDEGTAIFNCHGKSSCAGLLIIAKSCGGPIVFNCMGEGIHYFCNHVHILHRLVVQPRVNSSR